LSYVSSVGAYTSAAAITPARPNPDYVAARHADKAAQPDQQRANFGPATQVTLSPAAQAYLQGQKTDPAQKAEAKAAQESQNADAEARAKAEKAAAARKAEEAQHADQTKPTSLG
jgi:hypothetical protein